MPTLPPPDQLFAIIIVVFFGIGLHEYAHCKFADLAGDPTPSFYGRVTLNLFKHFEPLGTLFMFISSMAGVGIGWGRPAPMNAEKMHNPRWDFFIAVIAGPVSNIVQAAIYALFFRLVMGNSPELLSGAQGGFGFLGYLLFFGVQINVSLALFNMIPLGPLDGHWLLGLLLPEKQRILWYMWNRNIGRTVLMIFILFSQLVGRENPDMNLLGRILYPPMDAITRFFLGTNLFQ